MNVQASPLAPLMIVTGLVLLQLFVAWCRRVQARGGTPLLDLRVITSNQERAAVIAMFSVVALEAMLNFAVPLHIQIVQGRTPIETAIAMLPFNLTVFVTAMLVVRLYRRFTPRVIGMAGFALCTPALLWLAFVVRNDWSAPMVMTGLILFGLGQGALVTLVFNVLVTAALKIGLLIMACVSLLIILPASRLPGYRPDESWDGDAPGAAPGRPVPAGERA